MPGRPSFCAQEFIRSQNFRDPPPGAGMARTSLPSCSTILAKIAKPESRKCSETTCISIGLRRSGLSEPYFSIDSA